MGPLPPSARRAVGLVAVAVLLVFAAQAHAATFTVGSTVDTGGCASPPSGTSCTLRQLVNSVPAGSTIAVPAGNYALSAGELSIAQSMTIAGAGARTTEIDQQTSAGNARVFDIQPGVTATISGLSMAFGKADATSTFGAVGGDVLNQGTLTLSEDLVESGQTTGGSGGGISNQRTATLTVTHSLIEGNRSLASGSTGGSGGGIENFTTRFTAAQLAIDNSTIVGNTAAAGGGGVLSDCAGPCTSTATIINSTIAFNDGGTGSTVGGGLLTSAGTISVENSIVASNTVTNPLTGGQLPSNCGTSSPGVISSLGHNIETATDCGFTAAGDFQSTDPGFLTGGLQFTGGNTETIALKATSPAVDAIPSTAPGCSGTDQRDFARPQGTGCDIGAYELFQPAEGRSFTTVVGQVGATAATITWGDGTAASAATVDSHGQVTGTHTYAEEGIYHATINWRNSDGTPESTPFDVKVVDAPLAATVSSINATVGTAFNGRVATFTDADPAGVVSDYSATINWGDGTPASAGTVAAGPLGFDVDGTHTYANPGSYATTISIADAGGSAAVAHGTATVGTTPSSVLTGQPPSVGGTTAAFTGSVNPSGLPTTASFQYVLDPKYTGGGPLVYTQSTPAQSVGSDFSSHAVSASVTGLVPNALYHVRLAASNSAGTTFGLDVTFTTLKTRPPGPPAFGKTFNIRPVSGLVRIEVNGVFIPLTQVNQIPTRALIDARHGSLKLTISVPSGAGSAHTAAAAARKHKPRFKTQSGTFGGAIFRVTQATRGAVKGLATLSLVEGAFPGAPTYATCKAHKAGQASAATLSSLTLQLLHASAHGRFRTRGRYSAATVRGTKWTTADRCDGTLTHDITDSVVVDDFVHHRTIVLHAGQRYLARARR